MHNSAPAEQILSILTCADVDDVVKRVLALHDVHGQLGKTDVVLADQGINGDGLHNITHQEEPLCILQTPLC